MTYGSELHNPLRLRIDHRSANLARTLGKRVWRCPWRGHATQTTRNFMSGWQKSLKGTRRYCQRLLRQGRSRRRRAPWGGAPRRQACLAISTRSDGKHLFNAWPLKSVSVVRDASDWDRTKSAPRNAMRGLLHSPPETGGGRIRVSLTLSGKLHLHVRPNPGSERDCIAALESNASTSVAVGLVSPSATDSPDHWLGQRPALQHEVPKRLDLQVSFGHLASRRTP